jgi:hypothetical protein
LHLLLADAEFTIGDVQRLAAVAVVVLLGATPAVAHAAPTLRKFSYQGAGTNYVNLSTGELRELWKGRAKPFGKITTHVAGWVQFPKPPAFMIRSSMVIVDPSGEVLIGACSGTGILPLPHGHEKWTCQVTGGTGKFAHSRGSWTLHIDIHRIWIRKGVSHNRFTERATGRVSWMG